MLEGIILERDALAVLRPELAGEPVILVIDRPPDDDADVLIGQRLEAPDSKARQQRRIDFEVRVLGRCTDERDRAVLDVRQERVLLRLVEAVDLVDEQDGALAVQRESVLRCRDARADLGDAGHHCRERRELRADRLGEDSGERRLARPRRPPQEQRRQVATRHRAAERARLADEMALPLELLEGPRPHPRGERLPLGRRLEQGFGSGSGDTSGWHDADRTARALWKRSSGVELVELATVDHGLRRATGSQARAHPDIPSERRPSRPRRRTLGPEPVRWC